MDDVQHQPTTVTALIDEVDVLPVFKTNSHALRIVCSPNGVEGTICPIYVDKEDIFGLFQTMRRRGIEITKGSDLVNSAITMDLLPRNAFDSKDLRGIWEMHKWIPGRALGLNGDEIRFRKHIYERVLSHG